MLSETWSTFSLLMFFLLVSVHISCNFSSTQSFWYYFFILFHLFSLFFWPCPQYTEVYGPGVKPVPQLQPKTLQWQCWILKLLRNKRTPSFQYFETSCFLLSLCFIFPVHLRFFHRLFRKISWMLAIDLKMKCYLLSEKYVVKPKVPSPWEIVSHGYS